MGYKIFGIASTENLDREGEKILTKGIDASDFNFLKDEHTDNSFGKIGFITKAKAISGPEEASDWRQKKAWSHTKKPFLYYEAELHDDHNHPNAQAAAGLIDAVHRKKIGNIRSSIEGSVGERDKNNPNTITKAKALSVVLTVQPVNQDCLVWPFHDLKKSKQEYPLTIEARIRLIKLMKSVEKTKEEHTPLDSIPEDKCTKKQSLTDKQKENIIKSMTNLTEQLEQYAKSLYNVQCSRCNRSFSFSKFDDETPNMCQCGNYLTMDDFHKAITKEDK